MRKFYAFVFFIFAVATAVQAADKTWVGASGASWGTPASWSPSGTPTSSDRVIFNTAATVNLDVSPTVNGIWVTGNSFVSIQNPSGTKNWTFNANGTPYDGLLIDAGSTLELKTTGSTTFKLLSAFGSTAKVNGTLSTLGTASGSTAQIDYSNGGTWIISGTLKVDVFGGNPTGAGAFVGTLSFPANSIYEVAKNGGSVPTASWDAASLIKVTGSQASTVSSWSSNTSIGGLEYNSPGQTSNLTLSLPSNLTIKGNLRVLNTGASTRLALASSLNNLTVNGNVELSAFKTSLSNSTTAAASGVSMTVLGNLVVNAGTFDLQENSSGAATLLKLSGNLTIASGATVTATSTAAGANEIEFNGAMQQTVSVAGTISGQARFKVNNGAGLLVTTDWTMPASANSRITLTSGGINMGTNTLFLQNPATTALAAGSNSIVGKLRLTTNSTGTYVFPMATTLSELARLKINPSSTALTVYQAEFVRPNPQPRGSVNMPAGIVGITNYAWNVTRVSGTADADLNFSYAGLPANGGISNGANVRVLRWDGGPVWTDLGGTDLGDNSINSGVVTAFGTFALGSASQILPLVLGNFSGRTEGNKNLLRWTTTQEENTIGFDIERSPNGRNYQSVGFVPSQARGGNSTQLLAYSFADGNVSGRQYYRLRVESANGSIKYSNVVLINGTFKSFSIGGLYPNPVQNNLSVQVQSHEAGRVVLSFTSAAGAEVLRINRQVEKGVTPLTVSTAALPRGVYTLQLANERGERATQKIVKH